jgi:TRAP-type C4-dicarboxylate transport system permease small subunit
MVGLLQIMIYLFCVYLVYKGFEIFQIAFISNPENIKARSTGIVIGILAILGAILVSFIVIGLTDEMATKIGNNMQNLGR